MVSRYRSPDQSSNHPVRVALLQTDDTRSAAVRSILEGVPGFAPIVVFGSTAEATRSIRDEDFDVALIELSTRGMAGMDCLRSLHGNCGKTRLAAYTDCTQPEVVIEVFRIGVDGYLLRTDPSLNLVHAVVDLAAGQSVVSGEVLGVLLGAVRRQRPPSRLNLSKKERAVYDLIIEGHSCKSIASTLGICLQTVYVYNRNIGKKMGVSGRDGIRAAVATGAESRAAESWLVASEN